MESAHLLLLLYRMNGILKGRLFDLQISDWCIVWVWFGWFGLFQ